MVRSLHTEVRLLHSNVSSLHQKSYFAPYISYFVSPTFDLKGWHHRINRRAAGKSQLPLYVLIKLLHQEAQLTAIQIRLVSEKKLRRIQRRKYRDLQAKIFDLWEQYDNNERSTRQLLKACSFLNGPV